MRLFISTVAACGLALAVSAAAAEPARKKLPAVPSLPDKYVSVSVVRSPETEMNYTTLSGPAEYEFDAGLGGEIAFGVRRGGYRFEVSAIFDQSDVGNLNFLGTSFASSGTVEHTGLFLSAYWDFLPRRVFIDPYIGAGIGLVQTQMEISTLGVTTFDDDTTTLGLRGVAGTSVRITPAAELFGEVRYRRYGTYEATTTGGTSEFTLEGVGYAGGLRLNF